MKKLILLFVLTFSILSFSQTKDTLTATIDSTSVITSTETLQNVEKLVDKYSGKNYDLVKELAQNLKVPVEKLLTIITKQAIVESITNICLGLIGIWLLYLFLNFCKKVKTWSNNNDNIVDENDKNLNAEFIIKLIFVIIGFICLVTFILDINDTVTGLINPEFRIIEILSETLK